MRNNNPNSIISPLRVASGGAALFLMLITNLALADGTAPHLQTSSPTSHICTNFGIIGNPATVVDQGKLNAAVASCNFHYNGGIQTCQDLSFGGSRICKVGNESKQLRVCRYDNGVWSFPEDSPTGQCPQHLVECPAAGTPAGSWSLSPDQVPTYVNSCSSGCEINMTQYATFNDPDGGDNFSNDSYPSQWNYSGAPANVGIGTFVHTGVSCETNIIPPGQNNSTTSLSGVDVEQDPNDPDCVVVSGETICPLDFPTDDQCTQTGSGETVCSDNASLPEVPDNGVDPTIEAAPDLTVTNNTTNSTTNIYNNSTTNNSTTNQAGDPNNDSNSNDGNSDNDSGTDEVDNSAIAQELADIQATLEEIKSQGEVDESLTQIGSYDIDDLTQEIASDAIKETLGTSDEPTLEERESQIQNAVNNLIGSDGGGGSCDLSTSFSAGGMAATMNFPFCDYEWLFVMLGNMVYALGILGAWIGVTRST